MELLQIGLGTLVLMIALTLAMSFVGAWQAAASSVESVISTGALRPAHAVILAASLNSLGPFLLTPAIAALVATGLVDPGRVDSACVLAALATALAFAVVGARLGLSPNSTHTALGALLGASIAAQGLGGLSVAGVSMLLTASALAPAAAFTCAAMGWIVLAHLLRCSNPRVTDRFARKTQWLTCGVFNVARGNQIAHTGLGLIWLALIISGLVAADDAAPGWVFSVLVALAVGAGTLAGGFALIRQHRLSRARLRPAQAACAEAAAAFILAATSSAGIPVASPHVLTASTLGASQSGRPSLKHWGINARVLATAVLSLPGAALVGAVIWRIIRTLIA
jgi:PiT family inorganic phosphate transporter